MTWNEGTEVPEQYFFWSGISALSALVNGQVWTHMGRYQIFPNMYIVLLGPPGNGKTSALRRAEKIIRQFDDVSLSAQAETAEGLVRFMRDNCVRTFDFGDGQMTPYTPVSCYLSELSNFFGRDPGGMIDLLTGIWDCGGETFHRRTKGQGEDKLPRPNLNLLAGTTQDWITTYLKTDIIGGGFTRRVVFVNELMGDDTNRNPWPEDTPEGLTAFNNCIAYGRILRELRGEMKYGPGARTWWDKWYTTREISREPDVRGYHKSKPTILLKVATLIALSNEPKMEISISDLEVALALLDKSEIHLSRVFQGIGRNELNTVAMKIVEFVFNANTIKYTDKTPDGQEIIRSACMVPEKFIHGTFYREAPKKELEEIIAHLISTDRLFRYIDHKSNRTYLGLKESIRVVSQGGTTPTK